MEKYLISICIPTYNQPREVKNLLDSLFLQVNSGLNIEIIIRDDSADSETERLVNDYIKKSSIPIRYFRGEKEGVDKALIFLVQEAKGKYIWWIGDDVLAEKALLKVINVIIARPNLLFIWVNFYNADNKKLYIDLKEDRLFKDKNDVLKELGIAGLGFISAMIFKREIALRNIKKSEKYIGTSFVSLFLAVSVVAESMENQCYFLNSPIIINHPTTIQGIKDATIKGGKIKNEFFNVFGISAYNIIKEFENEFNKQIIREILKNNFASMWRGVLVGWIGGWDAPKGKRWKMFKYYWSFPEFWIAIIPFLMPLWINKILFKIYKIFFSHRKFVFNENFKKFLSLKNK